MTSSVRVYYSKAQFSANENSELTFIVINCSDNFCFSNGSDDDEESEVEIAGDGNGENAEGAVWNGSINGSQSTHHSMLPSQMAAADGAEAVAEEGQGTSDNNQSKQVRVLLFTCLFPHIPTFLETHPARIFPP